jgi:hypothetical protein
MLQGRGLAVLEHKTHLHDNPIRGEYWSFGVKDLVEKCGCATCIFCCGAVGDILHC